MKHNESKLQIECVKWFRLQYPFLTLFAIPNGGRRGIIEATIMKKEGVLAGVPDLFLAKPIDHLHGLFIEMKFGKGKQSEAQYQIMKALAVEGYDYAVISDFDSFKNKVNEYLKVE